MLPGTAKWYMDDEETTVPSSPPISKETLHKVVVRMEQLGVRPELQLEAVKRYAKVARYPKYMTEEEGQCFLENAK